MTKLTEGLVRKVMDGLHEIGARRTDDPHTIRLEGTGLRIVRHGDYLTLEYLNRDGEGLMYDGPLLVRDGWSLTLVGDDDFQLGWRTKVKLS